MLVAQVQLLHDTYAILLVAQYAAPSRAKRLFVPLSRLVVNFQTVRKVHPFACHCLRFQVTLEAF
jgi:hypothetical protein